MQGPVVRRAHREPIARGVSTTFRAGLQVMQVEEYFIPAAGHLAAALVAVQYRAAQRWRNALPGATRMLSELM